MKKRVLFILSVASMLVLASCSSDKAVSDSESTPEGVSAEAQEGEAEEAKVEVIKLEEITGEFTTTELTLEEGTYSFEVTNNGIDHDVAFVLAPSKEDLQQEDWIADAMLTAAVADGQTASSKKAVKLEKGEYVYFCPMNPTPQYKLTVE